MENLKRSFRPTKTIGAYLAGKQVGSGERLIIRTALTQLLLLSWRRYTKLPELAISKETPLMELPCLSDREKLWLATEIIDVSCETARFCSDEGQIFLTWLGDRYQEGEYSGTEVKRRLVTITVEQIDQYLKAPTHCSRHKTLTDYRLLRIYTLLYRPWSNWTLEERAIMREGGIKIAPKTREQRFYRAR